VSEDGNDKQLFTNKLPLCKPLMERRRCSLFVSQSVSGARDNRILSVLLNRTSQGSHPCQSCLIYIHSFSKKRRFCYQMKLCQSDVNEGIGVQFQYMYHFQAKDISCPNHFRMLCVSRAIELVSSNQSVLLPFRSLIAGAYRRN
jgi:hypothetical protein